MEEKIGLKPALKHKFLHSKKTENKINFLIVTINRRQQTHN